MGVKDASCQTVTGRPKCCMKPVQSLPLDRTSALATRAASLLKILTYRTRLQILEQKGVCS